MANLTQEVAGGDLDLSTAAIPDSARMPARTRWSAAPPAEICAQAESLGADLIVIGSHGRTGLKRFLLGSVAESVVRHAPVPVLVVREK